MKIYYREKSFDSVLTMPPRYKVWYLPFEGHYVGVTPKGQVSVGFYADPYAARRWCLQHSGGLGGQINKEWTEAEKVTSPDDDDFPLPTDLRIKIKTDIIEASIFCEGKKIPHYEDIRCDIIAGVFEAMNYNKAKTAHVLGMSINTVAKILVRKYKAAGIHEMAQKIAALKKPEPKKKPDKEKPYRAPTWELKS